MGDLEERIRKRAYQLWLAEGRPEGREEAHWEMAAELVAQEENQKAAREPNPLARGEDRRRRAEPVETAESVEALGDQPGLRDQGEKQPYPRTQRSTRGS